MKQKLFVLTILLISLNVNAQPFLGMGMQNKGVNFSAGVLAKNLELQANYKMPLTSAIEPTILSITAGAFIPITRYDEDNYSITIQAGAGFRKYRTYKEETNSVSDAIKDIKPLLGIELGKDSYLGRAIISVKYCNEIYYSIGFRCFFNR